MTPYQARFKEECKAKLVHFGQEVEYYPADPTDLNKLHKFGEKVKKVVFMGYKQSKRTGGKWSGDYYVLDYDDIQRAKTYKQLTLTTVKGSELKVPQEIDKNAPVVYPLVERIVQFPFEA